MAQRSLKKGDPVSYQGMPGEVVCKRRGGVYVQFPSASNGHAGHWLTEPELELDELSRDDLDELIDMICTADGQTRGSSPPHPLSVHGHIHEKLLRMRARDVL